MGYYADLKDSIFINVDAGNQLRFLDSAADLQDAIVIENHWHYWIEIKYVISGEIMVESHQEKYVMHKNQAIVIGSRKEHKLTLQKGNYRIQSFYLNVGLIIENFTTPVLTKAIFLVDDCAKLQEFIANVLRFMKYKDEIAKVRFNANLMLFLSWLAEQENTNSSIAETSRHPVILEIVSEVNQNYQQKLSFISFCERFNYSPSYLSALFKKHYGMTFRDFVLSVRLGHAKNLLSKTDMKVIDIAYEVGFTSDNTFIISFRKHYGVTPNAYRKYNVFRNIEKGASGK